MTVPFPTEGLPLTRWREVATHEAGHAVVARLQGFPIDHASLGSPCPVDPISDLENLGRVRIGVYCQTGDADRWRLALQTLAGHAADVLFIGPGFLDADNMTVNVYDGGDWQRALGVCAGMTPKRGRNTRANDRRAHEHLWEAAELLAEPKHWRAVETVSRALLQRGFVMGPELESMIDHAMRGRGKRPPHSFTRPW